MQTNIVYAVVAYDNRQPLPDDVANQLINLMNGNGFNALAVTVRTQVLATMTNPSAGTNTIAVEITSQDGTTDDAIIAWVTAAILALNLPTSPISTISAVQITSPTTAILTVETTVVFSVGATVTVQGLSAVPSVNGQAVIASIPLSSQVYAEGQIMITGNGWEITPNTPDSGTVTYLSVLSAEITS